MEKTEFAIAKFKYSKNDFYAIEIIERFKTYQQASDVFDEKKYHLSGGTWQDGYDYHIIDIKDDKLYYHDGVEIATIFD